MATPSRNEQIRNIFGKKKALELALSQCFQVRTDARRDRERGCAPARYPSVPAYSHTWRHQARRGVLGAAVEPGTARESGAQFVPVAVTTVSEARAQDVAASSLPIELVLRNGRMLRLAESVRPACVAALMDALEGSPDDSRTRMTVAPFSAHVMPHPPTFTSFRYKQNGLGRVYLN